MFRGDPKSLIHIADLRAQCVAASKNVPADRIRVRGLVLEITEELINYGRVQDSVFHGYQRILKIAQSLLQLLASQMPFRDTLEDFLIVVESILMYEDLCNSQNLELFAKFTLMRHGQTEYTNVGLDLTERGQKDVLNLKDMLCGYVQKDKETAYLVSSGAARAKGTLQLIFPDEQRFVSDFVTHIHVRDPEKASRWFAENFNADWSAAEKIAHADRLYVERKFPEDVFGPSDESDQKFFVAAELSLRFAAARQDKNKIPHFIAVAHFEFLNHFVMALFNLQIGNTLMPAEHFEICALSRNGVVDPVLVPIIVRFRNNVAKAYLNRKKRCIQSWTPIPLS